MCTGTLQRPNRGLDRRRLDRLCKVGDGATNRRFKPFGDISDSASSMDAYASWLGRVNRYVAKWNRAHGFFKLDPAEENDNRDYQRYKALSRQLNNLYQREIIAARHHNFDCQPQGRASHVESVAKLTGP
jgi:hypothetical protein